MSNANTTAPTPVRMAVDGGALALALHLALACPVRLDVDAGALRLDMHLRWDSYTLRAQALRVQAHWQHAGRISHAHHAVRWQSGARSAQAWSQRHQTALRTSASFGARYQRLLRQWLGTPARHQGAQPCSRALALRHQSALRGGAGGHARHQAAQPQTRSCALRHQAALRYVAQRPARYQQAQRGARNWRINFGAALLRVYAQSARYQQAMRPPAGLSVHIAPRPEWDGCYTPNGALLFGRTYTGAALLFHCKGAPRPLDALRAIGALAMYTHLHTAKATLWPSGEPLPLFGASIETDAGGWGWHIKGSGPAVLMDMLAPANGAPRMVRIEVCGVAWTGVVGLRQRNRRFGEHSVSFDAASHPVLLDAPHAKERDFANAAQQSAQQVLIDALEHSATTLDWRITDWVLPAGAWNHHGTPLSAVLRVADAAGAIVQSHRSANTLIVQPRYPALPWNWHKTAPAIQLPIDYCVTESLDEVRATPYNAVHTLGPATQHRSKRAGTAGDLEAAAITDALLTETAAHVQRAHAILGAGGWQARVGISLPLDTADDAPGLLEVGQLIEINDTDGPWRALVRGVNINVTPPAVRQSVQLERHFQ